MDKNKRRRYHIFFFLVKKKNEDTQVSKIQHRLSKRTKAGVQVSLLVLLSLTLLSLPRHGIPDAYIPSRERMSAYFQNNTSEVRHIAFLKVFKAGSSTVQNVLFRYGSRNNLTFIIPTKGNRFSANTKTHEDILDPVRGKNYDILAMHSIFNKTTYKRLLPKDTFYLAIVREPLSAMISGAYYNRDVWGVTYLQKVPKDNFIHNLITYPELYDVKEFSLTRNTMAWVFGFPTGLHVQDDHRIQQYLKHLDNSFDLVMILEHFSESLVLLRRKLNWTLRDILYVPLNTRTQKAGQQRNVTDVDKRKFESRNFLDVALYKHFYESFMGKISNQTDDFLDEVGYFKKVQSRVELFCIISTGNDTSLLVNESRWNERFLVRFVDCELMMMEELTFVEKLRTRHLGELFNSL